MTSTTNSEIDPLVVVTGASGFVGTYIVKHLLEERHRVRGTVRDLKNEDNVRNLKNLCPDAKFQLELVEAELLDAESWEKAVNGATYVIHVASPVELHSKEKEDEVIRPAVEGTLNVLKACVATKTVKRVVVTSAAAAIMSRERHGKKPFNEDDWNTLNDASTYAKSKTLAEKAAWEFVKKLPDENKLELAVINPTYAVGPLLQDKSCTSMEIPKSILEPAGPVTVKINFDFVDVQDVAAAHVKALFVPEAAEHKETNWEVKEENTFGWSRIPGMPANIHWPVEIFEKTHIGKINVYSKSDNAIFSVPGSFCIPHYEQYKEKAKQKALGVYSTPHVELTEKICIEDHFKKKGMTKTMECFHEDVDWVNTEMKVISHIQRSPPRSQQNENASTAETESLHEKDVPSADNEICDEDENMHDDENSKEMSQPSGEEYISQTQYKNTSTEDIGQILAKDKCPDNKIWEDVISEDGANSNASTAETESLHEKDVPSADNEICDEDENMHDDDENSEEMSQPSGEEYISQTQYKNTSTEDIGQILAKDKCPDNKIWEDVISEDGANSNKLSKCGGKGEEYTPLHHVEKSCTDDDVYEALFEKDMHFNDDNIHEDNVSKVGNLEEMSPSSGEEYILLKKQDKKICSGDVHQSSQKTKRSDDKEIWDQEASTSEDDNFNEMLDSSGEEYIPPSEPDSEIIPVIPSLKYFLKDACEDELSSHGESICADESDDDSFTEKTLTENEIMTDINYPKIYIRKVLKTNKAEGAQARHKKSTNFRVYNNYHSCYICGRLVQHLKIHLKTHYKLPEVRKLFKAKETNWTNIRKKGDDKHNRKVIEEGEGEIIVARRTGIIFDVKCWGPCPHCFEWVKLSSIKYHYRRCTEKLGNPLCLRKSDLVVQSEMLAGHIKLKPSQIMLKEVFTSILNDTIGEIAKSDPLIIALGETRLRQNIDNVEKRKYYASQRMRLCARLLLNLRELKQEKEDARSLSPEIDSRSASPDEMWEFIHPKEFDNFVKSALKCSIPYMDDEEELKSPSNAIKLKYDIKRLANAKWALTVKNEEIDDEEKDYLIKVCKRFLKLMDVEWATTVTKLARSVLLKRQLISTKSTIPVPSDIEKLTKYLQTRLQKIELVPENFVEIVKLCETRLLLFNRRRSGEIEVTKLRSYAARATTMTDIDRNMLDECSALEKQLLKTHELLTIRGKRTKPVPVIVPPDAKLPLRFLASRDRRTSAGITESNEFLFPNKANSFARAYASLKAVCDACHLKAPNQITSVTIRKYTATLTQMMGLSRNQLEWVCKHLGHTKRIHLEHYQQMSGFIERVHLSKLFIMQDNNLTTKFAGKNIEEIDITELITSGAEPVENDDDPNLLNGDEELLTTEDVDDFVVSESCDLAEVELSEDSESDKDELPKAKRPKSLHQRQRWTEMEMEELNKYFQSYFESKTTPRQRAIHAAKLKSQRAHGQLFKRANHLIIKKISAMNHKT